MSKFDEIAINYGWNDETKMNVLFDRIRKSLPIAGMVFIQKYPYFGYNLNSTYPNYHLLEQFLFKFRMAVNIQRSILFVPKINYGNLNIGSVMIKSWLNTDTSCGLIHLDFQEEGEIYIANIENYRYLFATSEMFGQEFLEKWLPTLMLRF